MKTALPLLSCLLFLHACMPLSPRILFANKGTTEQDFRIPAVVCNAKGELVAFSDRRYTSLGADIGAGRIDIQNRISSDNGASWDGNADNPRTIISGTGEEGFSCAHGDAAVVCDRETGKILLLCASGNVGFPDGGCNIGRYYSEDGGRSFYGGEMTLETGGSRFFSSGRICQSRMVKKGPSYRIYSSLVTARGAQIYSSDDFGATWAPFGELTEGGNESKVEELPDGSILLSCRIQGRNGRMFRVYAYDAEFDKVSASEIVVPAQMTAANCNGELLLAPYGREWVLLQSVPASNRRERVSIYWKRLTSESPYRDARWYETWDGVYEVCGGTSAYSTMTLDRRGNVAFLSEENNIARKHVESYDIVFRRLPLGEILSSDKSSAGQ